MIMNAAQNLGGNDEYGVTTRARTTGQTQTHTNIHIQTSSSKRHSEVLASLRSSGTISSYEDGRSDNSSTSSGWEPSVCLSCPSFDSDASTGEGLKGAK